MVVAPPRPVVTKKVEAPKKPAGPKSIVPPGTKRLLVVGKYVVMNADVRDCDAVIVEGNLDGNIKAKYVVIVKGKPKHTQKHQRQHRQQQLVAALAAAVSRSVGPRGVLMTG